VGADAASVPAGATGASSDGVPPADATPPASLPGRLIAALRNPNARAGDAPGFRPGNHARLQREVLKVVHAACDAGQLGLAAELLAISEALTTSELDIRERRRMTSRVQATRERLNQLVIRQAS